MAYSGKVALITGGASGMGRVAARHCSSTGASVAILDLNEAGLEEAKAGQSDMHSFKLDISDSAAVSEAVDKIEKDIGPIDRVYNAAAIMPSAKLLDQDTSLILKMMDINYGGLVNISKATVPKMIERGYGDFISFASMAGFCPTMYLGAYTATKFAVVAYTEVLYHENLKSGVNFACVCPPLVNTPLLEQTKSSVWPETLKLSETLEPEDVIAAIDKGIDKGKFYVFPGRMTRMNVMFAKIFPKLGWNIVHRMEGF